MATPSKRSKKSARAAGASESAPQPEAEAVEAEEAVIEDQEVLPSESLPEAEETEPTILLDGSAEEETEETEERDDCRPSLHLCLLFPLTSSRRERKARLRERRR